VNKFPVISLTGPRQSGKTTLLRNAFPDFKCVNLERLDQREMIKEDPLRFLQGMKSPVIFDEAQHIPELFSYIQAVSDERGTSGQYILSGSQSFLLNKRISQSLAGRVNINHLFPFAITEHAAIAQQEVLETIVKGFYPRLYDQHIHPHDFYPSYLQTYIERDIRLLKAIEDITMFSKFLALCAGRTGQIVNISSLANDTGISVNTAKAWLSLLESSFIIYLLQPYYKNFNKRIIKSPKLYFYDTGVLCSLLKITSPDVLSTHYLYGSVFENLVINEIIKYSHHSGIRPSIYYWRESNGTEIDCIIEKSNNKICMIEIKGGYTYTKDYLKNINRVSPHIDTFDIQKFVIYPGDTTTNIGNALLISWYDISSYLSTFIAE
jgi:hypothetical protein